MSSFPRWTFRQLHWNITRASHEDFSWRTVMNVSTTIQLWGPCPARLVFSRWASWHDQLLPSTNAHFYSLINMCLAAHSRGSFMALGGRCATLSSCAQNQRDSLVELLYPASQRKMLRLFLPAASHWLMGVGSCKQCSICASLRMLPKGSPCQDGWQRCFCYAACSAI